MLNLVGTQIVGFLMHRLNCKIVLCGEKDGDKLGVYRTAELHLLFFTNAKKVA